MSSDSSCSVNKLIGFVSGIIPIPKVVPPTHGVPLTYDDLAQASLHQLEHEASTAGSTSARLNQAFSDVRHLLSEVNLPD